MNKIIQYICDFPKDINNAPSSKRLTAFICLGVAIRIAFTGGSVAMASLFLGVCCTALGFTLGEKKKND